LGDGSHPFHAEDFLMPGLPRPILAEVRYLDHAVAPLQEFHHVPLLLVVELAETPEQHDVVLRRELDERRVYALELNRSPYAVELEPREYLALEHREVLGVADAANPDRGPDILQRIEREVRPVRQRGRHPARHLLAVEPVYAALLQRVEEVIGHEHKLDVVPAGLDAGYHVELEEHDEYQHDHYDGLGHVQETLSGSHL
jgi:hypothetical protein